MRLLVAPLVALGVLASAAAAKAQPQDGNHWDGGYDKKAERRSDFLLGTSLGFGVGNGIGYPNVVGQIDNPAYEVDTGVGIGGGGTVWLGGALRDWFSFMIGFHTTRLSHDDLKLSASGAVFRIEAFPFFTGGGSLRDLGFAANFGLGTASIDEGSSERSDGGALSIVGLGIFHETWRFGGLNLGPSLEYDHYFSQTLSANAAVVGLRLAFYSGPS
jgi:hypothetical protein